MLGARWWRYSGNQTSRAAGDGYDLHRDPNSVAEVKMTAETGMEIDQNILQDRRGILSRNPASVAVFNSITLAKF